MSESFYRNGAAIVALLLWAHGAAAQSVPPSRPGVVIVVEGIGGWNLMGPVAKIALRNAGLPHAIYEFRWAHGFGRFLKDLQDTRHLLAKAEELAAWIRQLHLEDPNRPIYLIGHSAGTGLVVRAAESAPPGSVQRVILLSSALSPTYDLRPVLAATRGGVVSFHSPRDRLMLNWGTRQFGTVDRHYAPSAGLNGFQVPNNLNTADQMLYRRLVQIPWNARMLLECNTGGHIGTVFPGFMMAEVAPWLRD